jgi:multisubunit Na+/H+ antiporter MnhG subunit
MNPQAPVYVRRDDDAWLTVVYYRFHAWSGRRPFWAGLFTLIGGLPIAYFPYADTRLGNVTFAMSTTAGSGSLIIGVLLVTLGLALWFQQGIRVFAGVAAILLALVSLPVSNLGGFFIGFVPAMVGGALALAWVPGTPAEETDPARLKAEAMDAHQAPQGHPDVPGPRETETAYASETTAHADGGRNSAG